jgi:hypothetical protein
MDVVCCDIRVVSSRKRRGERVGVGSRGKYPGAPPHHKGKRNQADRKRYLIGLLGEKGKAKKKKILKLISILLTNTGNGRTDAPQKTGKFVGLR